MSGKALPWFVMSALVCVSSFAQEAAQAPENAIPDLEARKESVVTLRRHVAQREERIGELANEILTLDKRLEARVDGIVKMLSEVKDSNESKTRVARSKEEAIAALKRTIDAYVAKRSEIREQMRTSDSPSDREALAGDVKRFDSRISKRVDQIVDLTKSFTQHEDFKKYESTGGGGFWNGTYFDNTRINEDWKQNRRETKYTDAQRKQLTDALRGSIENLKQREAALKAKLAANPGDAEKDFYVLERQEIESLLDQRQKQLVEVIQPEAQPDTKPLGQEQAYQLDRLLEDSRRDLADDFNTILSRYSALIRERTRVKELEDNLKAREAWLKERGVTVQAEEK